MSKIKMIFINFLMCIIVSEFTRHIFRLNLEEKGLNIVHFFDDFVKTILKK